MELENFNTTTPPALTMIQLETTENHTEKEYQNVCYAHNEYLHFYHNVWPWIDAIVISILPFLLLLAGNLAIVITISKAVKFRKDSSSRFSTSSCNKTNSVFSEAPQSSCSGTLDRKGCTVLRLKGNKAKSVSCGSDKQSASSSTYMLLGASFLFLFLTTPSGVYLLISDYLFDMDSSPSSVAKYRLAFSITIFLYYLNNSINFFIYYLTGSRFRKSFKEYFSSRDTLDSEGRLSEGGTKVTKLSKTLEWGEARTMLITTIPYQLMSINILYYTTLLKQNIINNVVLDTNAYQHIINPSVTEASTGNVKHSHLLLHMDCIWLILIIFFSLSVHCFEDENQSTKFRVQTESLTYLTSTLGSTNKLTFARQGLLDSQLVLIHAEITFFWCQKFVTNL